MDSLYVLKIEPTGFVETLHVRFTGAESRIPARVGRVNGRMELPFTAR